MLKKTLTYKDLDGNSVTEDFYFNISKAEITELELSVKGGFASHLNKIVGSDNGKDILATFKEILRLSVGRRSEDGRRFIKNQEITDEFFQTEAYSDLFMQLVTDAEFSAEFVTAILPSDMNEVLAQAKATTQATAQVELPPLPPAPDDAAPWLKENRAPTDAELRSMNPEQLKAAFAMKLANGS